MCVRSLSKRRGDLSREVWHNKINDYGTKMIKNIRAEEAKPL